MKLLKNRHFYSKVWRIGKKTSMVQISRLAADSQEKSASTVETEAKGRKRYELFH